MLGQETGSQHDTRKFQLKYQRLEEIMLQITVIGAVNDLANSRLFWRMADWLTVWNGILILLRFALSDMWVAANEEVFSFVFFGAWQPKRANLDTLTVGPCWKWSEITLTVICNYVMFAGNMIGILRVMRLITLPGSFIQSMWEHWRIFRILSYPIHIIIRGSKRRKASFVGL